MKRRECDVMQEKMKVKKQQEVAKDLYNICARLTVKGEVMVREKSVIITRDYIVRVKPSKRVSFG